MFRFCLALPSPSSIRDRICLTSFMGAGLREISTHAMGTAEPFDAGLPLTGPASQRFGIRIHRHDGHHRSRRLKAQRHFAVSRMRTTAAGEKPHSQTAFVQLGQSDFAIRDHLR